MDLIKISFEELNEHFLSWIESFERNNIVLYANTGVSIVLVFKYDFKFICEVTYDDLKSFYNSEIDFIDLSKSFTEKYLIDKVVYSNNILKYLM